MKMNNTVLIIGDVMLDEYVFGEVSRISPEAPIPIVNVIDRKLVLGGAANVAANVSGLNAKAVLISVIGSDANGNVIAEMAAAKQIAFSPVRSDRRMTTLKTRIIGNKHQVLRIDNENQLPIESDDEKELLKKIEEQLPQADIIVISDYGKGVCTENVCKTIIAKSAACEKRVIIDPKKPDWHRYSGAFLIKPNQREFAEVAGCMYDAATARALSQKYRITNILTTRSSEGMSLVSENECVDFPVQAREVFDVSGAGDTVIAAVATFLTDETELAEAVRLSNVAAGIAVSHSGTYAVSLQEIETVESSRIVNKTVCREEVDAIVREWKSDGKKIVFTNGCFDILHIGHITLLQKAKARGDILVVGLNSDNSVRRLKGKSRPIINEKERSSMLSALACVDAVIIFDEDVPYRLVERIMPDVIVKGGDYAEDDISGADIVKAHGGEVVIIPIVDGKSTTATISKMKDA